jgi:heptosyltransferase-3
MNTILSSHPDSIRVAKQTLRLPPRAVLIVCTQRIGDVLLATPLSRAIKQVWPETAIDFLVLPGTQSALEGNPDVRQVFAFPQRTNWLGKFSQLAQIWRKYDVALATIASDRARLFALAAAPLTLGFVASESGSSIKQRLLDVAIPFDDLHTHTVSMNLQLAQALGLPALASVVNPQVSPGTPASVLPVQLISSPQPYAVLHPNPKFRYKMWRDSAWVELGTWLQTQGLRVLLTASPDPQEKAYVDAIAKSIGHGCVSLAGQLSLAQTAELLKTARLYVGPDTSVTHIAAASGVPTIALFGPSNPVKWGPWPHKWTNTNSPWAFVGSGQAGNVWLIQGMGDCVPCLLEGCNRNEMSESKCLQELPISLVLMAAQEALTSHEVRDQS